MEPLNPMISVRSQRQAMDWSLVLVSQGIAVTIIPPGEQGGWALMVNPSEHGRAVEALRLYRLENRASLWARPLPQTGLVLDFGSLAWVILISAFFLLDQAQGGQLQEAGWMDNRAFRAGEWWRVFTAITLHADVPHLAANATIGLVLLGLVMGSYGSGIGALAALLAGACGNLAGFWCYGSAHQGLGASGMVLGALGLLTAQSLSFRKAGLTGRQLALRGLWGGVLLLVLLGLNPSPRSDTVAHVGGFVAGVALGGVVMVLPASWRQSRWPNLAAGLAIAGLLVVAWGLALR